MFKLVGLVKLVLLLAVSAQLAAPFSASAASTPRYDVKFVPPVTENRAKEQQFTRVLDQLLKAYPEIPRINLTRVYFASEVKVTEHCRGRALACYRPWYKDVIFLIDDSDDDTMVHELIHASIVDSAGSVYGYYTDLVEEGIAEFFAHQLASNSGRGYPEDEEAIGRLVELFNLISDGNGMNELRQVAFVEGKQEGISRRLRPYTDVTDPFATLNYYLKTEKYSELNAWFDAIENRIQNRTTVEPQTEYELTKLSAKTIYNAETPNKATINLFWAATVPAGGDYNLVISQNGEVLTSLPPTEASKATYQFEVELPYKGVIDAEMVVEREDLSEVVSGKTVTVNAVPQSSGGGSTTGGATPPDTVEALDFTDASQATVKDGKVTINWVTNRTPLSSESIAIKIYSAKTYEGKSSPLLSNKLVASDKGSETFTLRGAASGDSFTVQLVDRSTNKQLALMRLAAVDPSAAGGGSGGSGSGGGSGGGTGTGGGSGSGGTVPAGTNCYPFENTLFGRGEAICAPNYLQRFYYWAVAIAVIGAVIMIIYAGYRYTVSRGNPSEIGNAKETIISALVGLALLLLSYTILRFLGINVVDVSP